MNNLYEERLGTDRMLPLVFRMALPAVAAQIAGGTADAGMGIWSAAKIYGLDFLPVCVEQYDLIIPDYAWDTSMIRRVLEILAGPAFRARLEKLGGYTLDQPGRVRRVY